MRALGSGVKPLARGVHVGVTGKVKNHTNFYYSLF